MPALSSLAVFDDVTEGVVAFTDDADFMYANRAALEVLGVDSVDGRNAVDFRSPRAAARVAAQWRRLRREGRAAGEYEVRAADGRLTLVRFRSVANFEPGVHLLVLSVATPIPPAAYGGVERRSRGADLFRAIFDTDPDGLLVADDARRYVEGNRAARNFLGLSREELRQHGVGDFASDQMSASVERLWQVLMSRGSVEGLLPLKVADGIERTVHFHARAHVVPGRHVISFRLAPPERQTTGLVLSEGRTGARLTKREREVLTLLARGANAEEVAVDAVLSPETVRTHVRNAMRKLGARSRPHAVALAVRLREIDP
jgi:PAS domain S-box-containing protein